MNVEIDNFVRSLKNPVTYRILNYVYVAGTYKNYPVIIARKEQGMTMKKRQILLRILFC